MNTDIRSTDYRIKEGHWKNNMEKIGFNFMVNFFIYIYIIVRTKD